jgi:hypothetical protein
MELSALICDELPTAFDAAVAPSRFTSLVGGGFFGHQYVNTKAL